MRRARLHSASMRGFLIALLAVALFVAFMWLLVRSQLGVSCEACVSFHGRQACASARAADREEASREATSGACARIASGVTDSIACIHSEPLSMRCEGER